MISVARDITKRKKAEEDLRVAKEALSRYSRELERQVATRTEEISGILKYTPAVVYMKDTAGRYLLVNSRFEALFGVRNETVRGRTDADVLPSEVARQFQNHDNRVLTEGASLQVEEQILQENGLHTYLSVKFPIFSESGKIRGVCGIASDRKRSGPPLPANFTMNWGRCSRLCAWMPCGCRSFSKRKASGGLKGPPPCAR